MRATAPSAALFLGQSVACSVPQMMRKGMSRGGISREEPHPSANGSMVIFWLLAELQHLSTRSLGVWVTPLHWKILHRLSIAHLLSEEIYVGDLLDLDCTHEALLQVIHDFTDQGLISLPSRSSSDLSTHRALVLQLTPEGAQRSHALAKDLLRSIHEHCSLAGINPFSRREPAWASLSTPRQSRSNRRSHPHRRQS